MWAVSDASHTEIEVMTASPIMKTAIGDELPVRWSSKVAMMGERPPAITDDNWYPSDAPLYRVRVPKSSEKKLACGPYMAA